MPITVVQHGKNLVQKSHHQVICFSTFLITIIIQVTLNLWKIHFKTDFNKYALDVSVIPYFQLQQCVTLNLNVLTRYWFGSGRLSL